MKVLFMGTPDFAVPSLEKLIECGHQVNGVITQPDKPKGRGKAMAFSPVKEVALAHNIPVYTPAKINTPEGVSLVESIEADVIVVAAFGQILPKSILEMKKYGCVNVHSSLLPKYRGAAPIQWAVINGEEKSGVTTMLMDEGIDTGDVLMVRETMLDAKETGGSLFDRLAVLGAELLIDTLKAIEEGTVTRTPQNHEESTYVGMLKKSHGQLDFTKSALELERLIRGLNPWPSAFTSYNGKVIKIWDSEVVGSSELVKETGNERYNEEYLSALECGQVAAVTKSSFYVVTGKDLLKIVSIQPEGKKKMDCDAYLRGYPVEEGAMLGK